MSYIYSSKKIIHCTDTGEETTGDKYLTTKHWKQLRELVFQDRNGECERCHEPIELSEADIHHNCYKRIGKEKLADLTLLCTRCHLIIHKNKKAGHTENKNVMELYSKLSKSERQKAIAYMQKLIDER